MALVNTGALRNSVTYVVKKKGRNGHRFASEGLD